MKQNIRNASEKDIPAILEILDPFARKGIILPRSAEEIRNSLQFFFVSEKNGSVNGVISYHDYGPGLKEIRSLAVYPSEAGRGTGTALVKDLSEYLIAQFPGSKIFVLTYSPLFFEKLGFKEVDKDTFPEKIWKDCQNCPNREHCTETALVLER